MSSSKLHWHGGGGYYWATETRRAFLPGGISANRLFEIERLTDGRSGWKLLSRFQALMRNPQSSIHRTVQDAKLAAQADWEKRDA